MDLEGIMLSKSDRERHIPYEERKQNQTHRSREPIDGCLMGGDQGVAEKGEGIKICKLLVIKTITEV